MIPESLETLKQAKQKGSFNNPQKRRKTSELTNKPESLHQCCNEDACEVAWKPYQSKQSRQADCSESNAGAYQ